MIGIFTLLFPRSLRRRLFFAITSDDPLNDTITDGVIWSQAAADGGALVQYID